MATWLIPTLTDETEHYIQRVELDSVVFELTFMWNTREEAWFLSVADADGVALASGIKIVADWQLFQSVSNPDMPAGAMMAVDTSGAGLKPGLLELGERVLLLYRDTA
jgi:hypothetical protein